MRASRRLTRLTASALASLAVGCSFSGGAGVAADGGSDAVGEVDADRSVCAWGYEPAFFDPCDLEFTAPPDELTQAAAIVIDTGAGVARDAAGATIATLGQIDVDGDPVAVWALTELDSAASIEIVGGPALIIAVDGGAVVSGTVDLIADDGDARPPGSRDAASCGPGAGGRGNDNGDGASGGGGGGYGEDGGSGGPSDDDGDGIDGGAPGAVMAMPGGVRGGCDGGSGGDGRSVGSGGTGGFGGGAIHFAARDSIAVGGVINAGGIGGRGAAAQQDAGGGGGGSGGYIGLEAPVVDTGGELAANGGGGGGGSSGAGDGGAGEPGMPGQLGLTPAPGGNGGGGASGGDGADGAVEGSAPQTPDRPTGGGGGGGGGLGVVHVRSTSGSLGGTLSPQATTSPL